MIEENIHFHADPSMTALRKDIALLKDPRR
jgi:hypothetical protein